MMKTKIPFVGGYNNQRATKNSIQKCVNYYPDLTQGSKDDLIYIQTAGSDLWLDLRETYDSICRGLYYTTSGRLFVVFGSALVEVDEDNKTFSEVGVISVGASNVVMADNGYYLMLVDGQTMYSYNLTDSVFDDVSLDFDNPTQIIFYQQRFFAINQDSRLLTGADDVPQNNKFYWSELGPTGAIDWPALNFASTDLSADAIKGIQVASGNLWLIGTQSYEVWGGTTNPDLPVARFGGSSSNIGTNAPDSVSEIGDRVFWLGSSKNGFNQVFASNGYEVQRISTGSIEYEISRFGTTEDALGFTYQQEGHTFYVLTFITGNKTFVYDLSVGLWHERTSADGKGGTNRWDVRFVAQIRNELVFGNSNDAVILSLDLDKYDEWNGNKIKRILQGPVVHTSSNRANHKLLVLDVGVGNGLQVDPNPLTYPFSADGNDFTLFGNFIGVFIVGNTIQITGSTSNDGFYTIQSMDYSSPSTVLTVSESLVTESDGFLSQVSPLNPKIVMSFSDDNHTFSNDSERYLGEIGKYETRVSWAMLGSTRNRTYRFEYSDPCKCNINANYLSFTNGVK